MGGGSSSFSPSASTWSRQPMKLPDFDFHFFANEGETVAYGWPFPFTYTSRPVSPSHASRMRLFVASVSPWLPFAALQTSGTLSLRSRS